MENIQIWPRKELLETIVFMRPELLKTLSFGIPVGPPNTSAISFRPLWPCDEISDPVLLAHVSG